MWHFTYDSTNHSPGTEKEEYYQNSQMYLSLPSTFLLVLSIPDLCGRQGAGQAGQGKVTCYGIVWSDMENDFFLIHKQGLSQTNFTPKKCVNCNTSEFARKQRKNVFDNKFMQNKNATHL